jgi:hypothetical protein
VLATSTAIAWPYYGLGIKKMICLLKFEKDITVRTQYVAINRDQLPKYFYKGVIFHVITREAVLSGGEVLSHSDSRAVNEIITQPTLTFRARSQVIFRYTA